MRNVVAIAAGIVFTASFGMASFYSFETIEVTDPMLCKIAVSSFELSTGVRSKSQHYSMVMAALHNSTVMPSS